MYDRNVVGWFEIPVDDMDRAIKFYNHVFGWDLKKMPFWEKDEMAMFPIDMEKDLPGSGGMLYKGVNAKPGDSGTIVFFTSFSGNCEYELDKVKELGTEILMEKTEIPGGFGFMILVKDSEGNKIAVHSRT